MTALSKPTTDDLYPRLVTLTTYQNERFAAKPVALPPDLLVSVTSYGAVGDGITDDTAAIQAALADARTSEHRDYYSRPKALYFPAGTYRVDATLSWDCCVSLLGTGQQSHIILFRPVSTVSKDTFKPVMTIPSTTDVQSGKYSRWQKIGVEVSP